jgi:hypothetical protein
LAEAVVEPLTNVFGVSEKVVNMALADLLLTADPDRELWVLAGAHMVAIDTLVHNLLHRTGTLRHYGVEHAYGPKCYQAGHCADLVRSVAETIDARDVNPTYPKVFPRLVQHAFWRFCGQEGLGICNGNRIDDRQRCDNQGCPVYGRCERVPLRA